MYLQPLYMRNVHDRHLACLNPSAREYYFYSSVHKSYSRIDLFIIDSGLLKMVKSTQYHNKLISDHARLSLDLKLKSEKATYTWEI